MKLYIGTNTKMYKTIAETCTFLQELGAYTKDISREEMTLFVIPSFTTLQAADPIAKQGNILLGAQNMGWEDRGAFTGEISPLMLEEVGVQIVEIGHSERRHVLGETDEMENRKVKAALRHGFTPLLCIGETAAQKEKGISDEVLRSQIKLGLADLTAEEAERVWIAYEPVWAIGESGVPATPEYAEERHAAIRIVLCELFGTECAMKIPLLYGGSVNPENACPLIAQAQINGLFIGRSAWEAERFNRIIRMVLAENNQ